MPSYSAVVLRFIGCSFATLSITHQHQPLHCLRRRVGFYHDVAVLRNLRVCVPQYLLDHSTWTCASCMRVASPRRNPCQPCHFPFSTTAVISLRTRLARFNGEPLRSPAKMKASGLFGTLLRCSFNIIPTVEPLEPCPPLASVLGAVIWVRQTERFTERLSPS